MPSPSSSLLGERRRFRRGGWGKRIRGVIDVTPLLSFVGLGLADRSLLVPPDGDTALMVVAVAPSLASAVPGISWKENLSRGYLLFLPGQFGRAPYELSASKVG